MGVLLYFKLCFEGFVKFIFNYEKEIIYMELVENEKVEFTLRIILVSVKGLVEEWFYEVNIFSLYLGFG